MIPENDVITSISSHRSIRNYKSDPIADDVLQTILQAGLRASSSGNMQTWSVIVTRTEEKKRQLYQAHYE
ncbi:MAG: nitroreductase family protein [Deltaproteobacteria bacterium]|nr:nitroreductase family protein [Deltaproteobacteria bacterium]